MVGLIVLTLVAAYVLWSLLLSAEHLYTQFEPDGRVTAVIAGVVFGGLALAIVGGTAAALFFEMRRLIRMLF